MICSFPSTSLFLSVIVFCESNHLGRYHQVAQDDDTVAVNYWYDMCYDSRYVNFQLMSRIMDECTFALGGRLPDSQGSAASEEV
jgi:hypothetical protein